MDVVRTTTGPDVTVAVAGGALLEPLQARGCAKSRVETVEPHLRDIWCRRSGFARSTGDEDAVTSLALRLRRSAPRTPPDLELRGWRRAGLRIAECERGRTRRRARERDLQCSVADGVVLAHELVHAVFAQYAVAILAEVCPA